MTHQPYEPISCDLYDQLLAWSTQRLKVRVSLKAHPERVTCAYVVDVFTQDHAEWARLDDGQLIRLDLAHWRGSA